MMLGLSRATALKIAAVLSAVMGAFGVVLALPLIARGSAEIALAEDSPPYSILVLAVLFGVIAIVAAYGTWNQQRWGVILTILVNLLNGLSAAPGILFAPTPGLRVSAITGVIMSIVVIVLCLWRERRPATV